MLGVTENTWDGPQVNQDGKQVFPGRKTPMPVGEQHGKQCAQRDGCKVAQYQTGSLSAPRQKISKSHTPELGFERDGNMTALGLESPI